MMNTEEKRRPPNRLAVSVPAAQVSFTIQVDVLGRDDFPGALAFDAIRLFAEEFFGRSVGELGVAAHFAESAAPTHAELYNALSDLSDAVDAAATTGKTIDRTFGAGLRLARAQRRALELTGNAQTPAVAEGVDYAI